MIRAKFVSARPMSGIVRVTVDIKPEEYSQFNAMLDEFHIGLAEPPAAPKAAAPTPKKEKAPKAAPAPTPLEAAIAAKTDEPAPQITIAPEPDAAPVNEPAGSVFDDHEDHGGTPHDDVGPQEEAVSAYENRSNPEDDPDDLEIPGFLKRTQEPSGSVFDDSEGGSI